MAWCTLAKVCVLAMLVGVALVSAADHKKRGGHHPHGGHHARGHPARGHPARGHPARGHVARRPAAKGHLAHAHTAAAHPAVSGAMRARATSYGTPGKSYPGGSGTGVTTRYWDCCKPTCAWRENAGSVTAPVATCVAGGESAASASEQSGCNGGNSFVCNNQQPFVKNGKAYAWAAANVNGLPTSSLCCACYELTFKDSAAKGQVLTVQVSNTGSDLGNNHFDLQIPGGGFGIFTAGCPKQWPSTPATNWGKQYGGVDNKGQCNDLTDKLRGGCDFRFDWFKAANNPNVDFVRVACPTELTSISKCKRNDD